MKKTTEFVEKAPRGNGCINDGFMAVKRDFLTRYLSPDRDEFLEQAPITDCVKERQMNACRHEGFRQCMDTPREFTLCSELWRKKNSPWPRFREK